MPKTRKDERHTRSSGDAPDPLPLIKRKKKKKKSPVHDAPEERESRRASGGKSGNPSGVDQQRLSVQERKRDKKY